MRRTRHLSGLTKNRAALTTLARTAVAGLVLLPAAACGGSSSNSGSPASSTGAGTSAASSAAGSSAAGSSAAGSSAAPASAGGDTATYSKKDSGQELTYWASNQGTSLQNDKDVLTPELTKFTQLTGVKVNLQVVPWSDLLTNVLTATTSGKGPDVVNIGNTWSPSVQATGAFLPWTDANLTAAGIDKSKFLAGSLSATGSPGQPPTALPIYSLAYALYYNKAQFAAAGITSPPATWADFETDAKKLTTSSHWALSLEAGSVTENIHNAFTLSQQNGGSFFDSSGKATFNTPANVAGIKQYLDFLQTDKIVNPSDAQYSSGTEALKDFATGKTSMVFWQAASGSLKQFGMNAADIGVAPVPLPATPPAGGKKVTSMVAGINVGIFKSSKHQDAAMQLVKFLTSTSEQQVLNKTYGSLPSVSAAYSDPAFQTADVQTFKNVLSNTAAPLPPVPGESQFETLVGKAINNMFADAATGKTVSESDISSALQAAQQQVTTS